MFYTCKGLQGALTTGNLNNLDTEFPAIALQKNLNLAPRLKFCNNSNLSVTSLCHGPLFSP